MLVYGVSVAVDETAREVNERRVLPPGGLRETFEQSRPITALNRSYSSFQRITGTNFVNATARSSRMLDLMHPDIDFSRNDP